VAGRTARLAGTQLTHQRIHANVGAEGRPSLMAPQGG
jgi:SLT domain-containing protein